MLNGVCSLRVAAIRKAMKSAISRDDLNKLMLQVE